MRVIKEKTLHTTCRSCHTYIRRNTESLYCDSCLRMRYNDVWSHKVILPMRNDYSSELQKLIRFATFCFLVTCFCFGEIGRAQTVAQTYSRTYANRVVNAIYIAEGGAKAIKPFGILSVPCNGYAECRQICLNTVRNNWKRWQNAGNPGSFIEYLGSRYAPVEAHPLNRNWVPNVKKIMEADDAA